MRIPAVKKPQFFRTLASVRDGLREREPLVMRVTSFRFMCKSHFF
jgi:hypothetical protein